MSMAEHEQIPRDFDLIALAQSEGPTMHDTATRFSIPGFPSIPSSVPVTIPQPIGGRIIFIDTIPIV